MAVVVQKGKSGLIYRSAHYVIPPILTSQNDCEYDWILHRGGSFRWNVRYECFVLSLEVDAADVDHR